MYAHYLEVQAYASMCVYFAYQHFKTLYLKKHVSRKLAEEMFGVLMF